jgi:hypothetical protein
MPPQDSLRLHHLGQIKQIGPDPRDPYQHCAVAWTLANRGSKYWQVAWEQKLKSVERAVLGSNVYSRVEKNTDKALWGAARYSVTKLTIALSELYRSRWRLRPVLSDRNIKTDGVNLAHGRLPSMWFA